jgi:TonB-dependent SusC/RagA subfamily outer membrane receptor
VRDFFKSKIWLINTEMKRKFVQKSILLLVLIICTSFAYSQDKTLVGKVTTFDSIPLIGVDILVKSTKQSYKTDTLGRFQVFCDPEDKLEITAKGFYTQKVKVDKEIRLILVNLKLKKGDDNMDLASRYVNIGYGYVDSKSLLNAVSSVNKNEMDFSLYTNMFDLIQGQFPGVTVEGNKIIVRGTKTIYGTETDAALLVIDGMIVSSEDFANLSPLDVQSVDVLKDGSSSVYGSRGANGVVLVETKKGK